MDGNDAVLGVTGDVKGAEIVGGAAGGLEESGEEFTGRRERLEVGEGEELEEDVVTEDVGEGGGRETAAREVEEVVGDGEDGEGGARGEI